MGVVLLLLLIFLAGINAGVLLISVFNPILPKWFCIHMGWHLKPKEIGNDGCSNTGICPRCGKEVLQDSQGNWF